MDVLCGLVGLLAIAAGFLWLVRSYTSSRDEWQAFIDAHELTASDHPDGKRASGSIGKTTFEYSDGETWAHLSVRLPREELGDLHVAPEHVLNKLAKKLGGQDITMGDPTFDDHWRITCTQPQIAKHVLTRSVRVAFHNTQTDLVALDPGGMLRLENGTLRWASQLRRIRPAVLPEMVRLLGKCARKFSPRPPRAPEAEDSDDESTDDVDSTS